MSQTTVSGADMSKHTLINFVVVVETEFYYFCKVKKAVFIKTQNRITLIQRH